MNELEYTYAVARIRALEGSLLTQSVIEQLMACQNETQCLQLLSEKGWGDPADAHDPVKMLQREEEKIWEVISDLAPDLSVFDVLHKSVSQCKSSNQSSMYRDRGSECFLQ